MTNNIKIFLLFFTLLVGSDQMTVDTNSTINHLLQDVDTNQELDMECSMYSSSIDSFLIEYKRMNESMNFACQIYVKSATEKLKFIIDETVDQKLDNYLNSIEEIKLKITEMKKYSHLQSVQKLNKKYEAELGQLKSNLTNAMYEKKNLSEVTVKCQNDLEKIQVNLTVSIQENSKLVEEMAKMSNNFNQTLRNHQNKFDTMEAVTNQTLTEKKQLVDEIVKMNHNFDQTVKNHQIKYDTMEITIKNEINKLTQLIKAMQNNVNQVIVKGQEEFKSLEANLNETNNLILKPLLKTNIVSLIRNGDYTFGGQLFLKSKGLDLMSLINAVYNSNINHAENVIQFLNSFSDDEEVIRGYRLLFDQMIKDQHIYSTPTTTIAYRVFVDFKQKYENNENLIYLKAKLPQSLKNLPWNQTVYVQNVNFTKRIEFYNSSGYCHDSLRFIPHIYRIDTNRTYQAINLIPISNGKYFHIKHKRFDSYLYADTNEFAYDSTRRAVFGWRVKNQTKETGRWQLEPIEGSQYFKIKNIYWNEYLSVAEGIKLLSHLKLFTLRSGECEDDNCKWHFLKHEWNN